MKSAWIQPVSVRGRHHCRTTNPYFRSRLNFNAENRGAVVIQQQRNARFATDCHGVSSSLQRADGRHQFDDHISERSVSQILDHMHESRHRQLTVAITIAELLRVLITRRADDLCVACHIEQVVVGMAMTERAIARCDLDRKGAHKFVRDHQMMPRLVLDRDYLVARMRFPQHAYSFDGLNSNTIRRMSWSPVLVSP